MLSSRFVKGALFSNGRYTKEISFLPKMVYKCVRGRTSGRSIPVLIFFSIPLPPPEARSLKCHRKRFLKANICAIVSILFIKSCWRCKMIHNWIVRDAVGVN